MKTRIWPAIGAGALLSLSAVAQTAPEVTLTRIECGTGAKPTNVAERFSDTFAYKDLNLTFTFSCYLIKHGDEYMVWDTGFAPGSNPNAPKVGIVERLAEVKVRPEQVKYVGIRAIPPIQGANEAGFKDWMGAYPLKVEALTLDKDVWGDGTVMVIRTPGHTPGHSSLLVRLKSGNNFLLSGDAAHFHENYESNGVPAFNYDRAQTVASLERMKRIAANLNATVIIQHDLRDIGKLPAFPAAAK